MNFYFEKNQNLNNQAYKDKRVEFQKITQYLEDSNNIFVKDRSLLTFDNELMVWSILNGIEYLNLINSMWAPKTHNMIENDLIENFKFLNLNENDFMNFLKNKKEDWRYLNNNVRDFMDMKYMANSLNTYNNSKNFEPEIKQFILSSSPMHSQQAAIPIEEFDRLKKKFSEHKLTNFKEPEFIILEKRKPITKNIVIKKQNYCKLYDGNIYILYFKKNSKVKCS